MNQKTLESDTFVKTEKVTQHIPFFCQFSSPGVQGLSGDTSSSALPLSKGALLERTKSLVP